MAETTEHELNSAASLIAQLGLEAHPEGGWFRETWRSAPGSDGRAKGTAILFLLRAGEASHWHTVDAEELWFWQSGDPLLLRIATSEAGPVEDIRMGPDASAGDQLQGVVPTAAWQAAATLTPESGGFGYSLVSCVVVPGFDFAGFTLAAPEWEPGGASV